LGDWFYSRNLLPADEKLGKNIIKYRRYPHSDDLTRTKIKSIPRIQYLSVLWVAKGRLVYRG